MEAGADPLTAPSGHGLWAVSHSGLLSGAVYEAFMTRPRKPPGPGEELCVWGPTGPEVLSVRVLLSGDTPTGRQPGSLG